MSALAEPNLRREIKMLAGAHALSEVRAWIRANPAGFRRLHPPRQINNAYLDTPHLESLEENLAGIAVKRKLRLRWYGTSARAARVVVQIKGKLGSSGWKVEHHVDQPIDLAGASWSAIRSSIRPGLAGQIRSEFDRRTLPVFINHYQREYFVSGDRRVRLTLDTAQVVYDQRHSGIVNLTRPAATLPYAIVELKADAGDARLAQVSATLPLRFEAVSKYVMAAEAVLGR